MWHAGHVAFEALAVVATKSHIPEDGTLQNIYQIASIMVYKKIQLSIEMQAIQDVYRVSERI
jgi:hypothetical protein